MGGSREGWPGRDRLGGVEGCERMEAGGEGWDCSRRLSEMSLGKGEGELGAGGGTGLGKRITCNGSFSRGS